MIRALPRGKMNQEAYSRVKPSRPEAPYLLTVLLVSEPPLDYYTIMYPGSQAELLAQAYFLIVTLAAPLLAIRLFGGCFRSIRIGRSGLLYSLMLGLTASIILIVPYGYVQS